MFLHRTASGTQPHGDPLSLLYPGWCQGAASLHFSQQRRVQSDGEAVSGQASPPSPWILQPSEAVVLFILVVPEKVWFVHK